MNKHFMAMQHLGKRENYRYNSKSGFSLLIVVTIIGSVGLTLALVLSVLSHTSIYASYAQVHSQQAQGYADACAENALQRVRDNVLYTGTDSINFAQGSCTYTVGQLGSETKTIESIGVRGDSTRRVYVETSSLFPQITISSWQEVADF